LLDIKVSRGILTAKARDRIVETENKIEIIDKNFQEFFTSFFLIARNVPATLIPVKATVITIYAK
jgi:hypothetical protein